MFFFLDKIAEKFQNWRDQPCPPLALSLPANLVHLYPLEFLYDF